MSLINKLTAFTRRAKDELAVYRRVLMDRRTPWVARIVLGCAVAYLVSPIDLIPDFLPVIGQLDDLIIVPLLIALAVRAIPPDSWPSTAPQSQRKTLRIPRKYIKI